MAQDPSGHLKEAGGRKRQEGAGKAEPGGGGFDRAFACDFATELKAVPQAAGHGRATDVRHGGLWRRVEAGEV